MTLAYWHARVQQLRTGNTERIQPSLFANATSDLADELLADQDSRKIISPGSRRYSKQSLSAGSPTHPHQHGKWPDSE